MRRIKVLGIWLIVAFMIIGVLVSLPMSNADYWEKVDSKTGYVDVHEDECYSWKLTISGAYSTDYKLEYTIVVRDGPAIDVFVMDEDEYYHYINGETFLFYTAASVENTYYASISWYIPGDGTYYIVVDNTDAGEAQPPWNGVDDVARVEYDISVYKYVYESGGSSGGSSGGTNGDSGGSSGDYYSSSMDWLWPLIAILIIVVIIVIVVAVVASQKSKTPQTPSQTQYQPPMSGQQPPTPPWVKYCPKCGREIPNDANVCPYCGYKFQ